MIYKYIIIDKERAELTEIYNAQDKGFNGAWETILDKNSILKIKDWIV